MSNKKVEMNIDLKEHALIGVGLNISRITSCDSSEQKGETKSSSDNSSIADGNETKSINKNAARRYNSSTHSSRFDPFQLKEMLKDIKFPLFNSESDSKEKYFISKSHISEWEPDSDDDDDDDEDDEDKNDEDDNDDNDNDDSNNNNNNNDNNNNDNDKKGNRTKGKRKDTKSSKKSKSSGLFMNRSVNASLYYNDDDEYLEDERIQLNKSKKFKEKYEEKKEKKTSEMRKKTLQRLNYMAENDNIQMELKAVIPDGETIVADDGTESPAELKVDAWFIKEKKNTTQSPNEGEQVAKKEDFKTDSSSSIPDTTPTVKLTKGEKVIMIGDPNNGGVTLQELKLKCLTNQKYGYLTVQQILQFGMRWGFEDNGFISMFTTTYKTFINPKELLSHFHITYDFILKSLAEEGCEEKEKYLVVKRIMKFLRNWIQNCFVDIQFDVQIVEELYSFVGILGSINNPSLTTIIGEFLEYFTKKTCNLNDEVKASANTTFPKPYLPYGNPTNPTAIRIEQLNPIEVARQLTLVEFDMFKKITSEELLGLGWMKESKEWNAPNITQIISRSNTFTDWVATYILSVENLKHRRTVLKHFINIAEACYEMKNFNTLFEIILGLIAQPVYRLSQTWDGLSRSEVAKFKKYEQITSFSKNKRNYREELKASNNKNSSSSKVSTTSNKKPLLPYIGNHLTDLVFFDEGNPNSKTENGVVFINFTKRAAMGQVVKFLLECQEVPFGFESVEIIQQALYWQLNANVISGEKELHEMSKKVEP